MSGQPVLAYELSSDVTFTRDDLSCIHSINPTADVVITLPFLETWDLVKISNVTGAHTITIKDSGGATITALSAGGDTAGIVIDITGTPSDGDL